MKQHLNTAGATDIPHDNSRLFDIWQDHGYALQTPKGGAIWRLTLNGSLTLTVLKFETERLFHPSRRPPRYDGALSVVANDEGRPAAQSRVVTDHTPAAPQGRAATGSSPLPIEHAAPPDTPDDADQADPFGAVSHPEAHDHVNNIDMEQPTVGVDTHHRQSETTAPESTTPSAAPTSFKLDDPDIAQHFLDWIRHGIRDGKIYTNRSNALIHIVKEGVLIVSPLAFKSFIRSYPALLDSGKDEDKVTIVIQDRLKKMMTLANFHRQTEKGLNIHSYRVTGANKTATVRGWLLPLSAIYG